LWNTRNAGDKTSYIPNASKIGMGCTVRISVGFFSRQGIAVSVTEVLGFSKVQCVSNFTHNSLSSGAKAASQRADQRHIIHWQPRNAKHASLLALQIGFGSGAKFFNTKSMPA
jgi:hypothetical protein